MKRGIPSIRFRGRTARANSRYTELVAGLFAQFANAHPEVIGA